MARKAGGEEVIESARELLSRAKSADELRVAQAVLLPLEMGLSLEETARVIGRSVSVTCRLRTGYRKIMSGQKAVPRPKTSLRNRAKASLEREARVLNEVLEGSEQGTVVAIPSLKEKLEEALGQSVCLSTIYRLLKRHGWRKLAPDTIHPKGDAQIREEWKKNCPHSWKKSRRAGTTSARYG